MASLPESRVPWADYIDDYRPIRDKIAAVYPDIYHDFSAKIEADLAKTARLADREERLAAKVLTQRQNATAKDG